MNRSWYLPYVVACACCDVPATGMVEVILTNTAFRFWREVLVLPMCEECRQLQVIEQVRPA